MNALYNATPLVPAKKKKRSNSKEQKVKIKFDLYSISFANPDLDCL